MTGPAAGRQWQPRITSALTLAVCADAPAGGAPGHALAQMFTLAEHLAARDGELHEDDFVADLLARGWRQAENAPMTGTQRVLTAIAADEGTPWWRAAPAHRGGQGTFGSDAAVRASAAGLLAGAGLPTVAQLGRRSSMVTHAHADARDAAAVQACAVSLALSHDFGTVDADKFLAILIGQCRGARMRDRLVAVGRLCRRDATPIEAVAVLGDGAAAPDAVSAALVAFLRHPHQPLRAIEWARAAGSRWHASAIMTAVMGGAANPHARPSISWPPVESYRARIAAAATGLAAASPSSRCHRRLASAPAPAA